MIIIIIKSNNNLIYKAPYFACLGHFLHYFNTVVLFWHYLCYFGFISAETSQLELEFKIFRRAWP